MFLLEYIRRYKITYISVVIVFVIGTILGIFLTFKIPEKEKEDVEKYINSTIQISKEQKIDKQLLFKEKLIENLKTIGIIWILGCTVIASFTIYIFLIYKGVIFGYIITIIFWILGIGNGAKFLAVTALFKSLIFLPIVFLLATSGIRLYKEIIQKKNNLKQGFLRHSIIMIVCAIFAIIVSCIDSYFLINLLYFL